jgi:hypothetical protein
MANDEYNLNAANEQRTFDLIPANTIVTLQLKIRSAGAGDGWLSKAADGASEGLDCEFIVVDGPFAKRKLWQRFTMHGTTPGHAEAGEISRATLRAMLESARGVRPDDNSDAAQKARTVSSWGDFNDLRFVARLGVRAPQNGYAAKNTIAEVITPERQAWKQPEQIQGNTLSTSSSSTAGTPAATPTNAVARPDWAKD